MPNKKKSNLKPYVVSFRLTAAQYKLLQETFKNTPLSFVKSENAWCRKATLDRLFGRTAYVDKKASEVDVDAYAATAA
jgi:hypothetical protein